MRRRAVRAAVAVGALLAAACGPPDPPPPADADLVAAFKAQRAAFTALEERPEEAPLPNRPEGLERRDRSDGLLLIAWSADLFGPGGCSKGFAHPDEAPAPEFVVASLDEHDRCGAGSVEQYRALEGGWYLFFMSDD